MNTTVPSEAFYPKCIPNSNMRIIRSFKGRPSVKSKERLHPVEQFIPELLEISSSIIVIYNFISWAQHRDAILF